MQEAAASSNLIFHRDDGSSFQHTIRAPYNPENPAQADEECLERVTAFVRHMAEKGWHLKRPNGHAPAQQQAAAEQHASGGGNGEHTFTATKLVVERDKNDNKVGKLKGGQFLKFGVRLWPEAAAEMGINLDIPVGEHEIEPINVRYIVNDRGDPSKVVGYA